MSFIGYTNGTKGFKFMRKPNNIIFQAVTALFDEKIFLFCPDMQSPGYTPIQESNDKPIPLEDGLEN